MIGPDYKKNAGGLRHPKYGLMEVPQFGWQYAGVEGWIKDDTIMIDIPMKTSLSDVNDHVLEITEIEESPEGSNKEEEPNKTEFFTINFECGIKVSKSKALIIE